MEWVQAFMEAWNRKGTPVIYTAESRALCALEVLVNADELAEDYISISIEIPDSLDFTSILLLISRPAATQTLTSMRRATSERVGPLGSLPPCSPSPRW
jgi:RES domain-containing protein